MERLGYQVQLFGKLHIAGDRWKKFKAVSLERISLRNYLNQAEYNKQQPLLLVYGSSHPHAPHTDDVMYPDDLTLWPKYVGDEMYKRNLAAYYMSMITLDYEFDRFFRFAQESWFYGKSITILTSDHGHGRYAKYSCYDDGLRVPFFVHVKGAPVLTGRTDALGSLMDIVPTIMDLVGNPAPSFDGISLLPVLKGTQHEQPTKAKRYIFGIHSQRGVKGGSAVYPSRSVTDGKYKYILNFNFRMVNPILYKHLDFIALDNLVAEANAGALGLRNTTLWEQLSWHEKHLYCKPREEVYNLEDDPFEMNNLVYTKPPGFVALKEELAAELSRWMVAVDDTGPILEESLPGEKNYPDVPPFKCNGATTALKNQFPEDFTEIILGTRRTLLDVE